MLIVDAGPLFASAWQGERDHERCAHLLQTHPPPLQVPALAAAEAAYLMGARLGATAELALARAFASGELSMEPVHPADWDRIVTLMEQYVDMPLGMADASLIASAERLGAHEIATLDRRHFSAVRPKHVETFTLLP